MTKNSSSWKRKELIFLILYAIFFYAFIIYRSLKLSDEFSRQLYGLRPGWLFGNVNVYVSLISLLFNQLIYQDVSDAQWRNFRGNLPVLTAVFTIFSLLAHALKASFHFKARGMSFVWLLISSAYLSYLHGACILFIITIASVNYILVKIFAGTKLFSFVIWIFNLCFLICNRIYEGYAFSLFGPQLTYLDNLRGTFRWHICFNFVVLRMISFGYDYHWAHQNSHFDHEKHFQRCNVCKSGQTCYLVLQERSIDNDKFSYTIYLSYLVYAPLYISGPILSFKAFALQLDTPQTSYSMKEVIIYGSRWLSSFLLMELMTHLFFYNAFAVSGVWKQLSPVDIFIVGYGVLNFMWLKFLLIWRYFRLWSLINGIETPENMPRCINNCHNLESFWKNWHASYNKWLVRYMYIPLGGSKRKLLNVWVIFTFVALWHDLEWKLLSWAWLTCIFFIPEMILKSAANAFQAESAFGQFVFRELSAVAGSVTITCLMVANLVGYVIGPSGVNLLISRFLTKEGLPVLGGMLITFYIGTKLMFHISDATNRKQ